MSKEGPLPGFDTTNGGKYHLHSTSRLGSELKEFQSAGAGIIRVKGKSFRIVDYCPDGNHPHDNREWADGGNVALKPIRVL
jgi:hypothetical protein